MCVGHAFVAYIFITLLRLESPVGGGSSGAGGRGRCVTLSMWMGVC